MMDYVAFENAMYDMEEMMQDVADWLAYEEDMSQQATEKEFPTDEEMEAMCKALM